MCSVFAACTHDEVMTLLTLVGCFAFALVSILGLVRIGVEHERRKRAQYDLDALFRGVDRSRGSNDR